MATIDRLMKRIEQRLQSIIEGTTAALLPGGRQRRELGQWIQEVMRSSARRSPDGSWIAPDVYVITLPQAAGQVDDSLLSELAQGLQVEATAHGLVMPHPPVVRVVIDPSAQAPRLQVLFSGAAAGDTAALDAGAPRSLAEIPARLPGAFLIVNGVHTFPLNASVVTVGRDPANMLVISDPRVSRQHAQLRLTQGGYMIFDLQSTGGTRVNGQPVSQRLLQPGDVISLAGVPLVYGLEEHVDGEVTQKLPPAPPGMEVL
jgi:hypothetical protein